MDQQQNLHFKAMMTEHGRVVVPAHLRRLLGVEGTRAELFFHVEGDEVTLTTKMQALRRAQARL
ncbi:MAG: AbrB/MazE/SpoVT family DNA-binding domain-containing protein, partial [Gammaproteobacteria bacterium]|nr:AbrB/MazE/SpoVT family DNA-binding domain-containing protein [Gammaproteobacteria bacterium]